MSKLVDIETIRAEIERRRTEMRNKGKQPGYDAEIIRRSVISTCTDLLHFLDTLPEENTSVQKPFWVEGKGVYIPTINKILAPEDFDGGRKMTWNEAMKVGDIGNKRDWLMVLYWLDEVQSLLNEHGGNELEGWIWTNTEETNSSYAWGLSRKYSVVAYGTKTGTGNIRLFYAYDKPEEKPVDIEEEIIDYYGRMPDLEDTIKAAKHFYAVGQANLTMAKEKPVELEKEFQKWWDSVASGKINIEHTMYWYMEQCAHHFFNLGRSAKKD